MIKYNYTPFDCQTFEQLLACAMDGRTNSSQRSWIGLRNLQPGMLTSWSEMERVFDQFVVAIYARFWLGESVEMISDAMTIVRPHFCEGWIVDGALDTIEANADSDQIRIILGQFGRMAWLAYLMDYDDVVRNVASAISRILDETRGLGVAPSELALHRACSMAVLHKFAELERIADELVGLPVWIALIREDWSVMQHELVSWADDLARIEERARRLHASGVSPATGLVASVPWSHFPMCGVLRAATMRGFVPALDEMHVSARRYASFGLMSRE